MEQNSEENLLKLEVNDEKTDIQDKLIEIENRDEYTNSSSSSSNSTTTSSTAWEYSYSVNSPSENGFNQRSIEKSKKQHLTYVQKLKIKFEKLASSTITSSTDSATSVLVNDSEKLSQITNKLSSQKLLLDPTWMDILTATVENGFQKTNSELCENIPSEDEADELSETCDESEEQIQENNKNDNREKEGYDLKPIIPGVFIEEIGESSTDSVFIDNGNDPGRGFNYLREPDTIAAKSRLSVPNTKTPSNTCEAKNRHVSSKSLSCCPANSYESEEDDIHSSEILFSSKLSLAYDSKQIPPIIEELIRTEQTYIKNLKIGIKNYGNIFKKSNKNLPKGLRGKKWIILGNIEQICEFHDIEFLPMLFTNQFNLKDLFDAFMKFVDENCFYSYVLYTMNKKRSLKLCEEFRSYFKSVQEEIGDKLGINSFLVQPIQRLPRYSLLLQQFIMACFNSGKIKYKSVIESCCKVEKRVRNLLTTTNEAEEINDIEECYDINIYHQGKFKKMNEFTVYDFTQRRNYRSKAFIFDKCLIYTEIKDKRLIYRGCYPSEHIGFISKQKSFTLYYHKQKYQECEFTADKLIIDSWIELIREMINVFANEEKRKLKEKYSKNCDIYRRPGSVLLLRYSSRLSSDSGNNSVFSGSSTSTSTNSQEENSPRTTWYADSFNTL